MVSIGSKLKKQQIENFTVPTARLTLTLRFKTHQPYKPENCSKETVLFIVILQMVKQSQEIICRDFALGR